jgi:hypothetical protein
MRQQLPDDDVTLAALVILTIASTIPRSQDFARVGQTIEIRRLGGGVTCKSEISVAKVVHEEDDKIGSFPSSCVR